MLMCLNPLQIPPVYVRFHLIKIELQELKTTSINFVPLKNVRQGKLPMSGFDIRLMFTLAPRDSTLKYKRCVHF